MTIPVFDVALEVSKLKSLPANSANPAKVGGDLATLATLALGNLRLDAVQPQPPISNFSNFSSPLPRIGQTEGASAPAPDTGLDWLPGPPDDADPAFAPWWASLDLQDICRCFGVRVVRSAERMVAIFPPSLDAELVAATSEVLVAARPFLRQHMDKLPILTPADAVEIIKDVMRAHPGLRFGRGDGGSMWPLFPKTWTPGQRATVQALWFAAGDALDRCDFREIDQ